MPPDSRDSASQQVWRPSVWLILGCALVSAVTAAWIVDLHFIRKAGNPAESVPPAISVAMTGIVAILAAGIVWLISRFRSNVRLNPRPILFLYCCLLIAGPIAGIGLVERFLPLTVFLPYRASESNHMLEYVPRVPDWLTPMSSEEIQSYVGNPDPEVPEVVRQFFEGGADSVPWSAWAVPLGAWGAFFLAIFFGMFCIASILRRQWVDREKLVFPLADVPVRFCGLVGAKGPTASDGTTGKPLFRAPVFWVGFGFAAFVSAVFLLNDFYGFMPGFSRAISFTGGATKRPWVALNYDPAFTFRIVFTVIGLAFLIKQEISFSLWFSFFVIKVIQLGISAMGYTMPGFPSLGSQSVGGYFALALFCLWLGRRHFSDVIRKALGRAPEIDDSGEALSYRAAVVGALAAFGFMAFFLRMAGMSFAAIAMILVFIFTLVVTHDRIRAESGMPIAWAGPFAGISYTGFLFALVGVGLFTKTDMIMFATLGFLTIGYLPLLGATQLEAVRIAGSAGMSRRGMGVILHVGCAVAMIASFAVCLKVFYTYGLNQVGDYEMNLWHQIQSIHYAVRDADQLPRTGTITWCGVGALITGLLIVLRFVFLRFPIHPVGYVMLLTYGGKWMLGSVFIAWLVKAMVLRYGGITLFRKLVPFFIGLVLGEISVVGLWYIMIHFMEVAPNALAWG